MTKPSPLFIRNQQRLAGQKHGYTVSRDMRPVYRREPKDNKEAYVTLVVLCVVAIAVYSYAFLIRP